MKTFGLQKSNRLHMKKNFDDIFQNGNKTVCANLILRWSPNPSAKSESRVSIIVSKKLGNAVVRNRIKRLIKEVFRLNKNKLKIGIDMIFIPTEKSKIEDYKQTENTILKIWEKAEITK